MSVPVMFIDGDVIATHSYWTDDDRMNYQAFQRAVAQGTALAVQAA